MGLISNTQSDVRFSIVIGRVSTEDSDRILETVDPLRQQTYRAPFEVLIVDRLNDAISSKLETHQPHVTLLRCDRRTTLPSMRALGLRAAKGEWVVVTEDHCVPAADWLQAFEDAIGGASKDVVAIGGVVENGLADTAFDRATFLCEYHAAMAPRVPANDTISADVPGMNVAYCKAAIERLDPSLLTEGFWETTVHPALRKVGGVFVTSDRIVVSHRKAFSRKLFLRQRFLYSKYYAARRFSKAEKIKRALALAMAPALPLLNSYRLAVSLMSKKRLTRQEARAVPHLLAFYCIWAAGEMSGYWNGPAASEEALRQIE